MTNFTEFAELKSEFDNISKQVDELYDKTVEDVEIKSKILDAALKEQVSLQLQWELLYAHITALEKKAEEVKERFHSHAFIHISQKSNKILNSTESKKYADCDEDYVDACVIYNNIFKLKTEITGVLNTINTRKFMLKHITDTVINGVNNHII